MCVGWAWGDVLEALVSLPRRLEGLPQTLEGMRVVLGCGELAGVDSWGMQRISQHGFPCVLRHLAPRWPEPTVLRRVPAGPADQVLEGGSGAGPLPQFPQLRVGPALPPRSWGEPVGVGVDVGMGVGVGVRGGVGGPGGGCRSGGVCLLVLLRRGGARGADVAWGPRGLRLGVRAGPTAAAVVGHLLDGGGHWGLVWGWGHCWLPLVLSRLGWGWRLVGPGCGLWAVRGGGTPCLGRGTLRHEGGGGGVGEGGASHRALLPSGPLRRWQGLEVVEDLRGGLGPGLSLGAGLGC